MTFNQNCDATLDELHKHRRLKMTDELIANRLIEDRYAEPVSQKTYGDKAAWEDIKITPRGFAFAEDGGYRWQRTLERWRFWAGKYGLIVNLAAIGVNAAWFAYNSFFKCA